MTICPSLGTLSYSLVLILDTEMVKSNHKVLVPSICRRMKMYCITRIPGQHTSSYWISVIITSTSYYSQ